MSIEFLKGPASNVGQQLGVTLERAPLVYGVSSTAEVNSALLPSPGALQEMELAFRESFHCDQKLEELTSTVISRILLASMTFSVALGAGAVLLRPEWIPTLAGGLSVLLAANALRTGTINPRKLAISLVGPALALSLLVFVGQLLQFRLPAAVAASTGAFLLLMKVGHRPFEFFREWLYTHPRLTPEQRRNPKQIPIGANLPVLAAILAMAIILPELSNTLALVCIFGVTFGVVRESPSRVFRRMRHVVGQFLTYGLNSTGAPGVWIPRASTEKRNWCIYGMFFLPTFALTVSLQLFAPWDLLQEPIRNQFGEEALAHTSRSANGWLGLAIQAIVQGDVAFLWLLPVSLVTGILTTFYCLAAVLHRPLVAAEGLRRQVESFDDSIDRRPEAQWYWDRIRNSEHLAVNPYGDEVREAEHIFLGVEPHAQFPVLLSEEILAGHVYITGQTGSGKTTLGIMSILMQLMRGYRTKCGETSEPPPLVVLDFKGDSALFETLRAESQMRRHRAGITDDDDPRYAFKWFTPEAKRASYYFNPFQSLVNANRSDMSLCDIILDCLSLFHGMSYGRSFYSRKSRMMLSAALSSDGRAPESFQELFERIKELRTRDDFKRDTFELFAAVHAISRYEKIATAANLEDASQAINMADVLEHRQVVYFWMPAAVESMSVREIGKLAFFSSLTAAIDRHRSGREARRAYLVIDEFQRIAGENFRVVLEQAREFGLAAILANQTESDLKLHDFDLRPTVRTNTRARLSFGSADDNEMRELIATSGEELAYLDTASGENAHVAATSGRAEGTSLMHFKPRITVNDLKAINDHPLEMVASIARGSGYSQYAGLPHRVRTTYPLRRDIYAERKQGGPPLEPDAPEQTVNVKGPEAHDEEAAASIREQLEQFAATLED